MKSLDATVKDLIVVDVVLGELPVSTCPSHNGLERSAQERIGIWNRKQGAQAALQDPKDSLLAL